MKFDRPSEIYIEKAKLLSKEDAERAFSRMRRRYTRWMKDEKLIPLEAVALQLEYDDQQLQEWRDKIAKSREK